MSDDFDRSEWARTAPDADVAAEEAQFRTESRDPDSPSDPGYTPEPVTRRPLGCLIEIAETLILTIIIFWAIQTFVAQPYQVQQQSMRTTLEEGQYVLVDKLTPRFDSYSRGDIVVFHPVIHEDGCDQPSTQLEGDDNTPFIKRVIGEPGDEVTLRNGNVYVNGAQLDEPYVHGQQTDELGAGEMWTVPEGEIFVMGDNRGNSTDSRAFGPICENEVVGRAFLRYWPLNTIGILQTPTYPNVPPPSEPTGAE